MRNESKIGFIGIGTMGFPMVTNLIRKGFSVVVYDIRSQALNRLERMGAKVAENPKMVAGEVAVILTSLPGPNELRKVVLGAKGILAGNREGTTIVDFSTVDPVTIKEINDIAVKKGLSLIDAPVSGGPLKAKDGTLTIMVGARKDEVKHIDQILNTLGDKIFFVGKSGGGAVAKLINNYIVMCNMVVVAEAFNIIGKLDGIDVNLIYEIMENSSADSYVLRTRVENRILKDNYQDGFSIELGQKDLELSLQIGKNLKIPLFVGSVSAEVFRMARLMGFGKEDIASVFKLFREIAAEGY